MDWEDANPVEVAGREAGLIMALIMIVCRAWLAWLAAGARSGKCGQVRFGHFATRSRQHVAEPRALRSTWGVHGARLEARLRASVGAAGSVGGQGKECSTPAPAAATTLGADVGLASTSLVTHRAALVSCFGQVDAGRTHPHTLRPYA